MIGLLEHIREMAKIDSHRWRTINPMFKNATHFLFKSNNEGGEILACGTKECMEIIVNAKKSEQGKNGYYFTVHNREEYAGVYE